MWSMEGLEEEDDDESVMTSKGNELIAPKVAGSKEQGCTGAFVAEYPIS